MPRRSYFELLRSEFADYNKSDFVCDLLAGLTVAAVALPLALAFGVASGASASAGLVTAILSGLIIGALGGAPYQISGPTGAMSAVLIVLVQKYGLDGVWVAGAMSGLFLIVIGLLRLGRFISFVPAPVISGFTSGIAVIIAVGQIDNFLGIQTESANSALQKILILSQGGWVPQVEAFIVGLSVVICMLCWPKVWGRFCPGSLAGLGLSLVLVQVTGWQISIIGEIPHRLILEERLTLESPLWGQIENFLVPALAITALGAVESLLCGAVGSNMTGVRLQANQELLAQGVGNLVLPFAGGVPATAAIARSSVGIKSGGKTRLVSIFHSLALLSSMFVLAPVMSNIPLAALAGILIVTAWRMNEWEAIGFYFGKRFWSAIIPFILTLGVTITLDLTQAIIIGSLIAAVIFLSEVSEIDIDIAPVDAEKLRARGIEIQGGSEGIGVAYITGPLFFAAVGHLNEAFSKLTGFKVLILSMRGVSSIDTSGLIAIQDSIERLHKRNCKVIFAAVNPRVRLAMERGGIAALVGNDNFFWSAEQAILKASAG